MSQCAPAVSLGSACSEVEGARIDGKDSVGELKACILHGEVLIDADSMSIELVLVIRTDTDTISPIVTRAGVVTSNSRHGMSLETQISNDLS